MVVRRPSRVWFRSQILVIHICITFLSNIRGINQINTQWISLATPRSSVKLTHWGRVTHICVRKLTIFSSDNVLSPVRSLGHETMVHARYVYIFNTDPRTFYTMKSWHWNASHIAVLFRGIPFKPQAIKSFDVFVVVSINSCWTGLNMLIWRLCDAIFIGISN